MFDQQKKNLIQCNFNNTIRDCYCINGFTAFTKQAEIIKEILPL